MKPGIRQEAIRPTFWPSLSPIIRALLVLLAMLLILSAVAANGLENHHQNTRTYLIRAQRILEAEDSFLSRLNLSAYLDRTAGTVFSQVGADGVTPDREVAPLSHHKLHSACESDNPSPPAAANQQADHGAPRGSD